MRKERQHFVPKFYLRNFSYKANGHQIGVFNTRSSFFIQTAKLKTQAYKPFFYGKDGVVEEYLSEIESSVGPIINSIIQNPKTFFPNKEQYTLLLYFIVLMSGRNPVASDNIIENDAQIKQAFSDMSNGRYRIDEERITREESIKIALGNLDFYTTICSDLKIKFLINKCSIPFITGDNPVVKYNQFFENQNWPLSYGGYGTVGIKFLFPISPIITLIIYDGTFYKVGDKKKMFLEIDMLEEINQLNLLQFLNCSSIIFFNELCNNKSIEELFTKSKKYEKANQPKTNIAPFYFNYNGASKTDSIIVQNDTDCKINLKLRNVTQTKKAKSYKLNQSAAQLRSRANFILENSDFNQIKGYRPKISVNK